MQEHSVDLKEINGNTSELNNPFLKQQQQDLIGSHTSRNSKWNCCGGQVPRAEIVFFCQILILYSVIITALYNITFNPESKNQKIWIALLSSSIGFLLPSPEIKKQHG